MASAGPAAIVLQFGPHNCAGAVWIRDEAGVGVFEIRQREVREASVAATVTKQVATAWEACYHAKTREELAKRPDLVEYQRKRAAQ